jgi:hypothetical protein
VAQAGQEALQPRPVFPNVRSKLRKEWLEEEDLQPLVKQLEDAVRTSYVQASKNTILQYVLMASDMHEGDDRRCFKKTSLQFTERIDGRLSLSLSLSHYVFLPLTLIFSLLLSRLPCQLCRTQANSLASKFARGRRQRFRGPSVHRCPGMDLSQMCGASLREACTSVIPCCRRCCICGTSIFRFVCCIWLSSVMVLSGAHHEGSKLPE